MNLSLKNIVLLSIMIISGLHGKNSTGSIPNTLGPAGEINIFMVLGPIPAPQEGFGTLVFNSELDQEALFPELGKSFDTPLISGGKTQWILQSSDSSGYLDLHKTLTSQGPGEDPERVWHARSAFLASVLSSEIAQNVSLLLGTASEAQVFLNGIEVWRNTVLRGATVDSDTILLSLLKGENSLVIKVFQSHRNYGLSFFGGTPWQWGVYARLLAESGSRPSKITTQFTGSLPKDTFDLVSTPFLKRTAGDDLIQKFLLTIDNSSKVDQASVTIQNHHYDLGPVPIGRSVQTLWIPAIEQGGKLQTQLSLSASTIKKRIQIKTQKRWELYFMPFSHQDIGYTHTQPVTAEIQSKNLEAVLDYMNIDPEFKWTVETLWQTDQLFKRQGEGRRQELLARIKEGRISLSPGWTNSFTGQLSEEEALRSLEHAVRFMQEDGIDFPAFLYNDTPGMSWMWPGLLEKMGVNYLFAGINEVYNDYSLQRNLPKLFRWRGGDGGEVITFVSETYNEGMAYGLEKDPIAMEDLIAEQLTRLENIGWEYNHVALATSYLDNGNIPQQQISNIKAWNSQFAWPRFIVATSGDYVKKLEAEDLTGLPVLEGDWTSPWETRSQGEPERMLLQRESQRLAPAAEKLDIINWLEGRLDQPDEQAVKAIYLSLSDYSGHGSGLEAGYANREDNLLAAGYREQYVQKAWHGSRALAEQGMYRLIDATFSFAGQGILVFNPSSFPRSEVVRISFGRMPTKPLDVFDPRSNKIIPSAWMDETTLVFLANDLASMGYTKFLIKTETADVMIEETVLNWDQDAHIIENEYLRLQYNENGSPFIQSLYSKELKKDLFNVDTKIPALGFVSREPLNNGKFELMSFNAKNVEIVDLRPVGILLKWESEQTVAESFQIALWSGLPSLDITATVNLELLESPLNMQEICLTLPPVRGDEYIQADVAGGWLIPAKDILPGVTKGAISLRHGLLLSQKDHSLALTSLDARVLLTEQQSKKELLPVLNLVNNFPIAWNRNEVNEGSLSFRVQLQPFMKGSKVADIERFTEIASSPLFIRDSWHSADEPEWSAFGLTGSGLSIQSLKRSRDGKALMIQVKNVGTSGSAQGVLSSRYFDDHTTVYYSDLLESKQSKLKNVQGQIHVELEASQIISIRVENFNRVVRADSP